MIPAPSRRGSGASSPAHPPGFLHPGLDRRLVKQSRHLASRHPRDRLRFGLLRRDGADLRTPVEMGRTAACDEAGEGPDRRQALVACLNRTAAFVLEMGQETQNAVRGEILDAQPFHRLARPCADMRRKQGEGVAVATLCVAGNAP